MKAFLQAESNLEGSADALYVRKERLVEEQSDNGASVARLHELGL